MAEAPDAGAREVSGKNVDDAVNKALAELGLPRDRVEITVVSEGRPGILGVGAQQARVVVTPKAVAAPAEPTPTAAPIATAGPVAAAAPETDTAPRAAPGRPSRSRAAAATKRSAAEPVPAGAAAPAAVTSGAGENPAGQATDAVQDPLDLDLITESALDVLETLLGLMGFEAEISAREPETPGDGAGMVAAVLDIVGVGNADMGLLIGRKGESLTALQYMVNLIVNHQTHSHSVFGVDVEGYRRRREQALEELARRIADRVRQSGQAMTMEPMPPAERRIVHITLADHPDVQTVSIGEGESRKVAITPKP